VSVTTFWLGRGALFAFVLVLAVLGWEALGTADAPLRVKARAYVQALDGRLRFLRAAPVASRILLGQALVVLSCVVVPLLGGPLLLLALLPLAVFGPQRLVERRAARRTAGVEAQLEQWLVAVANALKASSSLGEAIASTSRLVPPPMSQEIDLVVREYELGTPLDEALQRFAERVPSKTVAGAVLALKVARQTGGNLPEMLETAGAALRELARLEGVVRSKTAEGKAQAWVVSVIPLPMVGAISAIDPHFFDPLTRSFLGGLLIAGATVLWAVAILMARKILAVDV
jgi:tight adherence protein B